MRITRPLSATHTYVVAEVSQAAYDEIAGILKEAGYGHVFDEDGTIDMHGIGIQSNGICATSCKETT